jgi:hypothetical protein
MSDCVLALLSGQTDRKLLRFGVFRLRRCRCLCPIRISIEGDADPLINERLTMTAHVPNPGGSAECVTQIPV